MFLNRRTRKSIVGPVVLCWSVCVLAQPVTQTFQNQKKPSPPVLKQLEIDDLKSPAPEIECPCLSSFSLSGNSTSSGFAADSALRFNTPLSFSFIIDSAAKLQERLGTAESLPLPFENDPASPLHIMEAKVKVVKRTQGGLPSDSKQTGRAIQASVKLLNTTNKAICGLRLYFQSVNTDYDFGPMLLMVNIDAYDSYTFHKMHEDYSVYWLGEPETVTVKVIGVKFADGSKWGEFYRNNPDGPAINVDTKPVPLNAPRPNYTEEARRNQTNGEIRLKVLVGADGSVKKVNLLSHLPDGLDEEAISTAYKLRFTPAMKDGEPVAYWVTMEVSFTL